MTDIHKKIPLTCPRTIRIFVLEPAAEDTAPIIGGLEVVDLDAEPQYEALSYAWGPVELRNYIYCDGQNLGVTRNCYEALVVLRHSTLQRRIWIDTICIDQTSTVEKNHQVPLMATIYATASLVFVWLGPGDEHSDLVSQFLLELSIYVQPECPDRKLGQRPVTYVKPGTLEKAAKLDRSLTLPYRSAYFSRTWTVQEIAVATNRIVVYGHNFIPWDNFVSAWRIVKDLYVMAPTLWSEVFQTLEHLSSHFVFGSTLPSGRWWLAHPQATPDPTEHFQINTFSSDTQLSRSSIVTTEPAAEEWLIDTLWCVTYGSTYLQTSNDRDRVFGMRWLTEYMGFPPLEVDYTKSTESIFTEYMKSLLLRLGPLGLHFIDVSSHHTSLAVPSWIIDFTYQGSMTALHHRFQLLNFASSGPNRSLKFETAGNTLRIEGVSFDTLSKISPLGYGYQACYHGAASIPSMARLWQNAFDNLGLRTENKVSWSKILVAVFLAVHPEHAKPTKPPHRHPTEDPSIVTKFRTFLMLVDLLMISFQTLGETRSGILDVIGTHLTHTEHEQATRKFEDPNLLQECESLVSKQPKTDGVAYTMVMTLALAQVVSSLPLLRMLEDLEDLCSHLSLFVTIRGGLGVCSPEAAVSDKVVLFSGGCSPYILRELEGEKWRYLGAAYVDGVMDGEIWPGDDSTSLRSFEIV